MEARWCVIASTLFCQREGVWSMKPFAAWLLGVVLVPFVALAQAPATNLNTITAVQVNGGTVTISGSQKANFTTFTMTDPPRLVIDISEAVFSDVPEEIQVGNGTVTAIRTASYGSEASSIARVLIGYEREAEADIQANGNQLVVRVAGGGGPAVAQAPGTEQPQAGSSAADAAAAAAAERQAQEKAAADAAAAARAEREAQEKAAADAAAAAKRDAEADAKRQEEARAAVQRQQEEQARAEADRKRQEEASRASAQAAADEKRRQEESAKASAQAAAEEKRRQEEVAQSAADERRAQQQAAAEEQDRRKAAARAEAEQRKAAQQSAAEERRAAAQAAAEERRAQQEAAAEERRQRQAEARASRESRQKQAVEPSRPSSSGSEASVSSRRKTLTLVGFQQQSGASRVFIRTNEPVSYSVSERGRSVVLELENTRVDASNNTLPLDTSYFATPVLRVDPSASGRDVRITIQLRQSAPFQARQEGNVISLDFQRTGR
ncbi:MULTISPECIES: AMIN domain-containing protein [Myxococcus]|uniref:AMIN domain-containing protein n=1 Tax=Myxococcus xanthus TaxID=34 RepID=A0AAE6KS62_MYXXA|nr:MULTISPECIES: AMIN domain-containing protein [Myxococcus]QDE67840.1 AMIN domain-containing protein [Myxococcus xanthus]QDE75117.1 AMIN domain-containing protein [Myxococcus xanthus]QDE82390.1 AMIN domain-containing protein [Myxococcus xanthus]WAM29140.1 AMIN domain-containing protein [Myxococcus sp. NMCA1]